ncbi:MAG TPA: hypothetical protein VLL76_05190 [Candidatus Omnitrophota bacterium]|nr:hypothetical protein [Candidatus Omnitrophota bacterium]
MTFDDNTPTPANGDSGAQAQAGAARDNAFAPHPAGHYCQGMARTVLQAASALLIKNSENGVIAIDKARTLLRQLGEAEPDLVRIYAGQEDKCRRQLWRRFDSSARKDPFRRLMTRPLEVLLEGQPPAFQRASLANYFKVLQNVYAEHFEEYEAQCRAVLHALLVVHGQALTWEEFYADPRTQRILSHALRRLITFLDTPAGQWLWIEVMSQGDGHSKAPSSAEADQVLQALHDTWRGLELAHPPSESRR